MSKKEKIWKCYSDQVDKLKDGLGMKVDVKIKGVVTGLNANGITTYSSCGGHASKGVLFPWVLCAPSGKPEYRYINEKEIKEKIIKKYNIISSNIFYPVNKEAEMEYYSKVHSAGETKGYKKWYMKLVPLQKNVMRIVDEFYKNRQGKPKTKIVYDGKIYANCLIVIPSERIEKQWRKALSKKKLINKLKETQKEMNLFANFLKRRFFGL